MLDPCLRAGRIFPYASIRRDAEDGAHDDDMERGDTSRLRVEAPRCEFFGRGQQSSMVCRGESDGQVDFLQAEELDASLLVEKYGVVESGMKGYKALATKREGSKSEETSTAWIFRR
ncbi:hypothetical protein EDD11_005957 [Mortierella claussenii]|nr:hypothetical protein EDD11_005957 [Mortierella claussenii]